MFDLQAGVHFEEVEVITVRIVDEFDRARGAVVHAFPQLDGGSVESGAGFPGQAGRRGFLDDFLVSALDRTIAFAESQHLAASIAENLHFHVASAFNEAFEKHAA